MSISFSPEAPFTKEHRNFLDFVTSPEFASHEWWVRHNDGPDIPLEHEIMACGEDEPFWNQDVQVVWNPAGTIALVIPMNRQDTAIIFVHHSIR